jgi:hypothetical protein
MFNLDELLYYFPDGINLEVPKSSRLRRQAVSPAYALECFKQQDAQAQKSRWYAAPYYSLSIPSLAL